MTAASRVALVTGASRGIGRACALALAGPGVFVGVNYRHRADEAQAVLSEIRELGGDGVLLPADVAQPAAVREAIELLVAEAGRLDILVNNAGLVRDGLVMRMSDDDWHNVIETDLSGPFYCIRAALRPMLRQRWGRIISLGSVVGVRGNTGQANYAAAKAGLAGLTKSVAREVAGRNITVNVVAPGFIETEMTEAMPQAAREAMLGSVPMGRPGSAAEVAALVAFLAGDGAGYITGQVIMIDGGLAM